MHRLRQAALGALTALLQVADAARQAGIASRARRYAEALAELAASRQGQ